MTKQLTVYLSRADQCDTIEEVYDLPNNWDEMNSAQKCEFEDDCVNETMMNWVTTRVEYSDESL